MHGIPIILKDNFDTADLPTSGGSLALANHQPKDDAFVVRRLRDAGAIILGKSNMHELAAGITRRSARWADRHAIRTIRGNVRADRAAVPAPRSQRALRRSDGDRTRVARFVFPRRSAVWRGSGRRRGS